MSARDKALNAMRAAWDRDKGPIMVPLTDNADKEQK